MGVQPANLTPENPALQLLVAPLILALAELDGGFFRVRFDRLTPAEKRYMRAMADLGPGPHRSGDIAEILGKKINTVAPVRNRLIAKGMVFSPSHGDTAFTVPLFDGFMKRIMPSCNASPEIGRQTLMSAVGQIEKGTQARVVALFPRTLAGE